VHFTVKQARVDSLSYIHGGHHEHVVSV